jgi:hypothetical protein
MNNNLREWIFADLIDGQKVTLFRKQILYIFDALDKSSCTVYINGGQILVFKGIGENLMNRFKISQTQ